MQSLLPVVAVACVGELGRWTLATRVRLGISRTRVQHWHSNGKQTKTGSQPSVTHIVHSYAHLSEVF